MNADRRRNRNVWRRPAAAIAAGVIGAALISIGASSLIARFSADATRHLQALTTISQIQMLIYGDYELSFARVNGASLASLENTIKDIDRAFSTLPDTLRRLDPDDDGRSFASLAERFHRLAGAVLAQITAGTITTPAEFQATGMRVALGRTVAEGDHLTGVVTRDAKGAERKAHWTTSAVLFGVLCALLFAVTRFERSRRREAVQTAHEEAAREEQERFRALVERAADMITVTDAEGAIVYDSPSVERLLGIGHRDLSEAQLMDMIHPDDHVLVRSAMERIRQEPGASATVELRRRDSSGSWHWIEAMATNLLDDPAVRGIVTNYRLIDDRKRYETELVTQAFHDPLTGLPNRVLFAERVGQLLARRDRGPGEAALMFLDLDDFKTVNDGLGHAAGDELLVRVAARLLESVRDQDTVARLGGDEFAVLLVGGESGADWHERFARRLLDAMSLPLKVQDRPLFVRASLGIVIDDGIADDVDGLLRDADAAMYIAKARGKGRFEVFSEGIHMRAHTRLVVQSELREAIDEGQFEVYYQPIVSLLDGTMASTEALVRWQHPERGLLPPDEFIGIAEETGLIVPLGNIVLQRACTQLAAWQGNGMVSPEFSMHINVSVRQLQDEGFLSRLQRTIESFSLDPGSLVLEITETALMTELELVERRLAELKETGVRIAIDDFGTGYSSLVHLRRFPIDVLKIDKSFIDGVTRSTEDAAITQAVLKLARAFDIPTVAEGVERPDQQMKLRRMGCRYAQGYLFGYPVPGDKIRGAYATVKPRLTTVGA